MSATNDVSLSEDSANSVIDRSSAAASTRVRGVVLLRASLFTQLGVFGASDCGVARVFKPSPTLTDDSMTAPYRYTSCFNTKAWTLSFEWSPLPEIDLSTRDTREGRLSDRYDACVRPPPLEAAYDAADGCHTKGQ